jgi:hypothetical protein
MDKQTKINLIFIGGIIFLLFGLFKFTFGLVNFIYKNNNDNNKVLKFFLSPDKTTASLVYEVIIFLFGIYSIIKGSYYLKLITYKPLVYLIEHHIDWCNKILNNSSERSKISSRVQTLSFQNLL